MSELDDLNADLIELLGVIGPLLVGGPFQHDQYTAFLVGLEGEEVYEQVVPAESDGNPPHVLRVAYTKPPGLIKWDASRPDICFDTIEYHARAQCSNGCCVWYYRLTGPWG